MNSETIHVVKLGGSLLDLPDFVDRFEAWRRVELGTRGVLIVGGGAAADAVRRLDQLLHLGEEKAHWLAVRAMALNTHAVAAAVDRCELVAKPQAAEEAWEDHKLAVVDPWEWLTCEATEGLPGVPHRWTFTSDSIAAHVAARLGAAKLTLLKSALPPSDCGPACAAGLGIVDEDFPEVAKSVRSIELVNLRSTPVGRCVLR